VQARAAHETIAKSSRYGETAEGPYALELRAGRRGVIESVNDDEIRKGHSPARRDHGSLHEDGRPASRSALTKLAEAGPDRRGRRAFVADITGEGLKTLDSGTRSFGMHEISQRLMRSSRFDGVSSPPPSDAVGER